MLDDKRYYMKDKRQGIFQERCLTILNDRAILLLNKVATAPRRIVSIPKNWEPLIDSPSKIIPKMTTKTGSNTDNRDAFSALEKFNPLSKNRMGSAVERIPNPTI